MRWPHSQSHVTLRYCGHVTIKNIISPLSQGLWTPNLTRWWLRMTGPHPQSHGAHRTRGHVTNEKRYISTLKRSMFSKTWHGDSRWGGSTQKITWLLDPVVTWKFKNVIFSQPQGLWLPSLARWVLRLTGRHAQSQITLLFPGLVTKTLYLHFHVAYAKDSPWQGSMIRGTG